MVYVFFIDKKSVDNYNNEFSQSKNQEDKLKNRTILFQQSNENSPAKHILIHLPEKEIFISTLHPAASLYEDVTDYNKVKECFDNLKKILKEKNIELITVRSALKLNKTALKRLAFKSLKYLKFFNKLFLILKYSSFLTN